LYTEKDIEYIIEEYQESPNRTTVDSLAEELSVSPRSIIGKLSKLGVYRKAPYTPKYAEKPISKEELVTDIAHQLDLDLEALSGLSSSKKPALLLLHARLGEKW
jgi:hypothetical protein